jgi:hypothetical protein
MIKFGKRHEDQEGSRKVLGADCLAFIVTLVLAEVIMPELLLDVFADDVILFFRNRFLSSKNIGGDLLNSCNEIFFVCFHIPCV